MKLEAIMRVIGWLVVLASVARAACDPNVVGDLKKKLGAQDNLGKALIAAEKDTAIEEKLKALDVEIEKYEKEIEKAAAHYNSTAHTGYNCPDPIHIGVGKIAEPLTKAAEDAKAAMGAAMDPALKAWNEWIGAFNERWPGTAAYDTNRVAVDQFVPASQNTGALPTVVAAFKAFRKQGAEAWTAMKEGLKWSDLRGTTVVLEMLPKDQTADCHAEIKKEIEDQKPFSDQLDGIRRKDEPEVLQKLRERYDANNGKPSDTSVYFRDERTEDRDRSTADYDASKRTLTIKAGGNLWEVARQLVGNKASPKELDALVKKLKKSLKNADGSKVEKDPGNVLVPGQTINLAELEA